jgi:hypothetical protein
MAASTHGAVVAETAGETQPVENIRRDQAAQIRAAVNDVPG